MADNLESAPNLDCAAVTHSSKFLCVTNRRARVRRIASDISHVWYARNVNVKPNWDAPSAKSLSTARRWLRLEIPLRRGFSPTRNGSRAGIAIVARMNRVHIQGDTGGSSQLTINVRKAAGAERVRRRLSSIFQRPIVGIM